MPFALLVVGNLLRQKIRTGLTILGMSIGVTAVVALGILTHSAIKSTAELLIAGRRQRVAIARALANDPPIVLADEPTGNLDSKAGKLVLAALRDVQRKQGVTLVLVTHDQSIAQEADRIVYMLDGRMDVERHGGV